ncbi:TonB-dependent siderophore receptor [Anabaena cylindrica FACHB-243]|uniref:TonB-dependent siderophore receptor n=1 Tax=Anabaena cylindrica (strain ATCC 27899 / PCC 7122) TaxID=272123 RepID=K9ZNG2_ANACC|nr:MULTISPECIES: TonB-dependent receptor [Anabaena]AFZ60763.1 TonB-dependent siderophore receptor [Anabaena cylindrica PCC 7122]MBD2419802.1 TonB-dependent siderophore receptor [Anabaena cylindrica FACHB-243]MBY5281337.1 TonB-dependent siderophore receptor [Anabaena sp. CCAP 1446/1C]MBY5309014.1 TonB-dependent siderophore receptor [Anabaena sp. CCAP 1446/1C]MCM2406763.1 TonB-dependent siderophore receptor [Anabaena sp. CCAP 1446/1C]
MKISIFLAGALALVAVQPVWAESISKMEVEGKKSLTLAKKRQKVVEGQVENIPYLSDFVSPTRTIKGWLSQANSAVIQVTGVKANSTDKGVEILLETSQGDKLQLTNRSTGNSYIADIANAQLRLPSGEAFTFRSENPVAGITEITATNQDANTIRVSIIGKTSLPTAELFDSDEGLIFGLTPIVASSPPQQPATPSEGETQPEQPAAATPSEGETQPEQPAAADEPIELVVTGEKTGYQVPSTATVTRTDTPLIDVPQSIQVIPQEILKDQQITRIDDALRNVPGVVGSANSMVGNRITIRGFSTTSLPILRDGFRIYDNFSSPEASNLERIEVLKGPASVQYGQLDPGGVINLVTKQPLSEPFAEVKAQFGSYGLVQPSFDISGPLTSDGKLLYRLNALYQKEDGFREFNTETENFFIAPSLTWNISDRTKLNFSLEYLDRTRPFDTGLIAFGNGLADVPYSRIFNDPNDSIDSSSLSIGYNLDHRFSDNWTLRNAFRYLKQDATLQATLPGALNETTGILTRTYALQESQSDEYSLQTNAVGKFTTGSIKHTLLAGVDFNRSVVDTSIFRGGSTTINIFNPVYGFPPRTNFANITPRRMNEEFTRLGFYLQDQMALNEKFMVLAGLRYDTVDFKNLVTDATKYDEAFSPVIGLVYKPIQNISVYTSYSRSFVPSFAVDANSNYLEAERGAGYEIGIKAELLQGNLLATLAYFDITKQNVSTADPDVLGASVATGEQKSRGLEISATGTIAPGWNIIAGYAYTDTEITEDNTIPVGNRLPGTPKHTANLWTTYEIQEGSLQGLGFGIGFNYVDKRFGNFQNDFEVDSYFLTNAALFYRKNNWRVGLNFNNLFDIDYISSAATLTRTRSIEPGQPFTVIGSISMEF